MNRDEAIKEIENGMVISHKTFLPTEFVYLLDGFFYDERHEIIPYDDFWEQRKDEIFDNDWIIFREANYNEKVNYSALEKVKELNGYY